MRFLIDMPVTPRAVEHLVAKGHDAVHAFATGLSTASDEAILERARLDDRIVVTADLDYPRLLAAQRSESPGVILFRGGSLTDEEMLRMLDSVLERLGPERISGAITVVDRSRIRWHRLPIDP